MGSRRMRMLKTHVKMATLKLFIFLLLAMFVAAQGPNPVVRVTHGVVKGSWKVSTKGRTYASFEGIPYARPPIGKYRFREPQNLKPWTGVWNATRVPSACLQYDPFNKVINGSENCLFLNVYTPKPTQDAKLPVMFFIYGGAFMYGESGIYDPSYIMDWDMVIVTVNYRVGPLGFLSTGDEIVPGNFGLKDQSMALHWVKNNILMFGGNPDSVTLTGWSAGGASVHYHLLSSLSIGTFKRAIAFSGSAFAPWTYATKPAQKAKTLATIVGCPTTTSKEMVECLKSRPAEAIVNAQVEMFEWKIRLFTPFTPTVEAPNVTKPFLTQYPYQAAMAGAMQKLPLIVTGAREDGLYPAAAYQATPGTLEDLEAHWEQLASNIFEYNDTLPLSQRPEVAAKIKQYYLGGKPVSQDTFHELVQALSDRHFAVHGGNLAYIHALKSNQPTYLYKYSFRGNVSLSNFIAQNNENYGVSHGDDILHIFNFLGPQAQARTPDDKAMVEDLINMVYSFSTTGTPKLLSNGPEWIPVKPCSSEINYLEITSPTKLEMKSDSDYGHKSFWDNLGLNENEAYNATYNEEL